VKKVTLIFLFILVSIAGYAQHRDTAPKVRKPKGYPMFYEVIEGDTVYMDVLDPVWCFPRGRKLKNGDWRKEYKLVYNFNKVYPYALVGRKMMRQVDSTIAADVSKKNQRNAYTRDVQFELFRIFEKDIRNMTINQGVILMRLVDRECGMSCFEIIKEYRSGFAANFWQLVARLFGTNLKKKYDPKGADSKIEALVKIWESGGWDAFYYSIFYDHPKKTKIKAEELKSTVKSREARRIKREKDEQEKSMMESVLEAAKEFNEED